MARIVDLAAFVFVVLASPVLAQRQGAQSGGSLPLKVFDPSPPQNLGGPGTVVAHREIGELQGGFTGQLGNFDVFGASVTALGDIDGDGVHDLAVGAFGDEDGGASNNGAVWVLFLNADGSVRAHQKISATEGGFTGFLHEDAFGVSVAALGDLDGDEVPDLAVGAYRDDAVWILFLQPDGTVKSHGKIIQPIGASSAFGRSVTSLGDLDGDGVRELAVGASGADGSLQDQGAVWIHFMEPDGTFTARQKISESTGGFTGTLNSNASFGESLAALGDFDHDGVADLVVGAEGDDDGGTRSGAVWLLFLQPDGTVKENRKISATEGGFTGQLAPLDLFGGSVAVPGDLDGNGVSDLAVGARNDDDGGNNRGAVWVLFLEPDGTVGTHQKISSTQGGFAGPLANGDQLGVSLGEPYDLDGDGVRDLVVGAWGDDGLGGTFRGAVWQLALDGVATIDFENRDDQARTALTNGQDVSSPAEFGRTIALASSGANLGPAIFDSTPLGPNDPSQDRDLLVGLGNVLIFQNSQVPTQTVPGVFDRPNDDQDGGTFVLAFRAPVAPIGLDLVDIDLGATQGASVALEDSQGRLRVYSIPMGWTEDRLTNGPPGYRTLDLATLDPQPGFLSIATASEDAGFDATSVVALEVELGSSGALDNLSWDPHPN